MSPKCLPSHYGGTLDIPLIDGPTWYKILIQCEKEYEGGYENCVT